MRELALNEIGVVAGAGIARNMVDGALIGTVLGFIVSPHGAAWAFTCELMGYGAAIGAALPAIYGLADYVDANAPGFSSLS